MQDHVAFLLRHLVSGLVGGGIVGGGVLWYDIGSIRTLAFNAPMADAVLVVILLFFGLFVTFGSVAMGIGIWSLARERDGEDADS